MTNTAESEFLHAANIRVEDGGSTIIVDTQPQTANIRSNLVQYRKCPLTPERRHYRLTVVDIDSVQYIMTGLNQYCWPDCPEWNVKNSLRYHSNEGGVYNGGQGQRSQAPYKIGDTVTCRVSYFGRYENIVEFLLNERCVYRQVVYLPCTELYPTVGFAKTTAKVKVEWPRAHAKDVNLPIDQPSYWLGWSGLARNDKDLTFTVTEPLPDKWQGASLLAPRHFFRNEATYFEVTLLKVSRPEENGVGIGVASPLLGRSTYPGWTKDSVGYHSDDGGFRTNNNTVSQNDAFKCKEGDVMGCGIVFPSHDVTDDDTSAQEPVLVTVYFTKNGQLVYHRQIRQPRGGFYPAIAIGSKDDSVKLHPPLPPKFSTSQMETDLVAFDVASCVKWSNDLNVAKTSNFKCTVEATSDTVGCVQLNAHPLTHEGQSFTIIPTHIPQGDTCKILIGVAEEMVSADDVPTWLSNYSVTSGHITMTTGTNLSWIRASEGKEVKCMLDYMFEDKVLMTFWCAGVCFGRAVFKRSSPETSFYATVTLQGNGVKVTVDWAKVLFPVTFREIKTPPLSHWLMGEGVITDSTNRNTAIHHKATSIQSPFCFKESLPYVHIEVKQPNLPSIGVGTATSDLQGLIGSRAEELTFDPMTGDLIFNNEISAITSIPQSDKIKSLGVGVMYTQQDCRKPQTVIVYFTVNSLPVHKTVITSAVGGVFPTLSFPEGGATFTLKPSVYPNIPETMRTAWLENVKTAVTQGESGRNHSGTFSFVTQYAFSKDPPPSQAVLNSPYNLPRPVDEGITETRFEGNTKYQLAKSQDGTPTTYRVSIPLKMVGDKVVLKEDADVQFSTTETKDKVPIMPSGHVMAQTAAILEKKDGESGGESASDIKKTSVDGSSHKEDFPDSSQKTDKEGGSKNTAQPETKSGENKMQPEGETEKQQPQVKSADGMSLVDKGKPGISELNSEKTTGKSESHSKIQVTSTSTKGGAVTATLAVIRRGIRKLHKQPQAFEFIAHQSMHSPHNVSDFILSTMNDEKRQLQNHPRNLNEGRGKEEESSEETETEEEKKEEGKEEKGREEGKQVEQQQQQQDKVAPAREWYDLSGIDETPSTLPPAATRTSTIATTAPTIQTSSPSSHTVSTAFDTTTITTTATITAAAAAAAETTASTALTRTSGRNTTEGSGLDLANELDNPMFVSNTLLDESLYRIEREQRRAAREQKQANEDKGRQPQGTTEQTHYGGSGQPPTGRRQQNETKQTTLEQNQSKIQAMTERELREVLLHINSAMPDTLNQFLQDEGDKSAKQGKQPWKTAASRVRQQSRSRNNKESAVCQLM